MMKNRRQRGVIAIIPAAGLGKRFGPGNNKPFQDLLGKPIILWSLETLQALKEITEIIPVLREEDAEKMRELSERHNIAKIKRIAEGGKERQDSVYNGLKLIEDTRCIVLIHDAARPLIEKDLIKRLITEMLSSEQTCDGIIPGVPVKDTVKEADRGLVKKTLKRDSLWAVQTPQIFPYKKLWNAYEQAMEQRYYATDDAALVEQSGGQIRIITGTYRNIKITTPEDLVIAEALLRN